MNTSIKEQITVGAVFGGDKKMRPVWFIWNRRRYRIREITYCWAGREGNADVYHFSVTDGSGNLYELCYNSARMIWLLNQVACEG